MVIVAGALQLSAYDPATGERSMVGQRTGAHRDSHTRSLRPDDLHGIVTKLDVATGHLLQEERVAGFGNYFASPVSGDGKVYFASESGTVSVVAAEPDWRIISSHDFHEKIDATPVLAHDRLYLRTEQAMYCFSGPRP